MTFFNEESSLMQAYVALSRVSSLEGLHLLHYSSQAIRAHPKVLAFDRECKRLSVDSSSPSAPQQSSGATAREGPNAPTVIELS